MVLRGFYRYFAGNKVSFTHNFVKRIYRLKVKSVKGSNSRKCTLGKYLLVKGNKFSKNAIFIKRIYCIRLKLTDNS